MPHKMPGPSVFHYRTALSRDDQHNSLKLYNVEGDWFLTASAGCKQRPRGTQVSLVNRCISLGKLSLIMYSLQSVSIDLCFISFQHFFLVVSSFIHLNFSAYNSIVSIKIEHIYPSFNSCISPAG